MTLPAPISDDSVPIATDLAPRNLPRLRPKERKIAERHWEGLNNSAIGRELKCKAETVAKVLKRGPVERWLACMDERAASRMADRHVGARAKLAAHEELFADTLIEGVREAKKPLEKVVAGEKALGLIGIVAPKEIHSFSVEAKLKDVSVEELRAWAEDGRVPKVMAAEYAVVREEKDGD